MRSILVSTTLALTAFLATGCGQAATPPSYPALTPTASTWPSASPVQFVDAEDVRPSQTLSDWVTYADYIAVVTVQTDSLREPTKTEVKRGEGSMLRDLVMSVDEVLWTAPNAAAKLPTAIEWTAIGSAFSNGGKDTVRLAIRDTPRLEQGHSYILALYRHPEVCSEGDEQKPYWDGLGAGSVVPYDSRSIGQGESAGSAQTVAKAADQVGSVEAKFAGQDAGSLAKALSEATPNPTKLSPYRDPACG